MIIFLLQQVPLANQAPGTPAPEPTAFAQYMAPWIGPVIIAAIVTFIGQVILNKLNSNRETIKEQQSGLIDAVMPLQEACDDLIARYFDIFAKNGIVDFNSFDTAKYQTNEQLANPDKELTTIYRLIRIFVGSVYLQRKVPSYPHIPQIEQADFFIGNKFRMALKGNVSGSKLKLSTETQQCIGSKFLNSTKNHTPHQMDFFHFYNSLKSDPESVSLANFAASILKFDHDITQLKSEQISFIIALVYLIDFHQDLMRTSKWEEFRLLLVSSIIAWNRNGAKQSIFLYKPDDLNTDNYFDTYPLLAFLNESEAKKVKRIEQRQSRGRKVVANGVIKTTKRGTQELKFKSIPGDILSQLQSVLGVSRPV